LTQNKYILEESFKAFLIYDTSESSDENAWMSNTIVRCRGFILIGSVVKLLIADDTFGVF
jgi:hypothetical protein